MEASFAVTLPVQIGDAKTWNEAFVVPGSTPHLISRRWLSQHRCVLNFDPNNLCLESPDFGSVPLVLHSSGHLLLSLVNPSNTLDQFTVMIDFQSSSSSICTDFQKLDEKTIGSLQSRNQVVDKRAEPDEERAADSSMVTGGSDPPDDFPVPLDDPNEEITEQWHDDLHEWYICRDDQCPVESTKISRDVSQRRGHHRVCSCLKRRFVSVSTNSQISTFQRCLCVSHLFGLPAPRKVDSSNRTHIPAISGVAANGSSVVGKSATTTGMMCLYLLMVGITFCLDRAAHAPHVAGCLFDQFFVCGHLSRRFLEQS